MQHGWTWVCKANWNSNCNSLKCALYNRPDFSFSVSVTILRWQSHFWSNQADDIIAEAICTFSFKYICKYKTYFKIRGGQRKVDLKRGNKNRRGWTVKRDSRTFTDPGTGVDMTGPRTVPASASVWVCPYGRGIHTAVSAAEALSKRAPSAGWEGEGGTAWGMLWADESHGHVFSYRSELVLSLFLLQI